MGNELIIMESTQLSDYKFITLVHCPKLYMVSTYSRSCKPRLLGFQFGQHQFYSSVRSFEIQSFPFPVLLHQILIWPDGWTTTSVLQPMLCVSAVNPFLFTKVPALHHVTSTRKKLGSLLPYVRCPFRVTINKGLGSRRYLLESNDFFALRDLIDLSKGAFAG